MWVDLMGQVHLAGLLFPHSHKCKNPFMNETPPPRRETARPNIEPEPITLSAEERKQEAIAESSDVDQTLRKVLEDCERAIIEENAVKTDPWIPALEWVFSISAALFLVASFAFVAIRAFI